MGRTQRVLIVDDEDELRFLIRCWLETADRYEVVGEAGTGAAAIEAARQLQPDLAVMDVRMPNGDGEEATRIIGSVSPKTRVLAYSASVDGTFVLRMIGAGADGYLVKSGHLHEVVEALDAIADGDMYLSPSVRGYLFAFVRSSIRGARASALTLERDGHVVDAALMPGVLQIAFQPIVELRSGRVVGHEALSRFPHLDTPGDAFAAAARVGRSAELEIAAARQALRSAGSLGDDDGGRGFVSINASPDVILASEFQAVLAEAEPSRVVLELTEQVPVRDYGPLGAAIDPLRRAGMRLAIDDVGGGFACLTHVHRLLPDIIKIDRYLVEGVDDDPARRSMVAALVVMAADIGATIVAEGVERPRDLGCLQELGVDLAQGFLLGVPSQPEPSRAPVESPGPHIDRLHR